MVEFSNNKPYLLRALYEWILDNQGTPHLIVNADYPEVQVPREHVSNGEIVLNISPGAVQGLALENEEVSFNARFSGVARVIRVPMASILAIIARENSQGMAFPSEESDMILTADELAEDDLAAEELTDEEALLSQELNRIAEDESTPELVSSNKTVKPEKKSNQKPKTSHLKVVK